MHEARTSGGAVADATGRPPEKATSDLGDQVEQASNTFRAASEQVIARLEAVNAKLVEVEQASRPTSSTRRR